MARFTLDFGAEIDLLSKGELDDSLRAHGDALVAGMVEGIKWRRLPRLYGTADSGVLTLGEQAPQAGPEQGYAWSVTRIFVDGLTGGATPDVVRLFRNGTSEDPLWQISGASPQERFGRGQLVLLGGDQLIVASSGTFAATGTITVSGELWEVPQLMLGKLA